MNGHFKFYWGTAVVCIGLLTQHSISNDWHDRKELLDHLSYLSI
jgi:hypothetical protein